MGNFARGLVPSTLPSTTKQIDYNQIVLYFKFYLFAALKDISQGYEHLIQNEMKPTNLSFLPLDAIHRIDEQRELALENDHHLAVLLNENSFIEGQYIFRNPDCTVRMKAKRDHIRVTVLEYIPQTGSVAVGFNFGAFQIWNLMTLALEFTSQVNVECLPVTHFGFQVSEFSFV